MRGERKQKIIKIKDRAIGKRLKLSNNTDQDSERIIEDELLDLDSLQL